MEKEPAPESPESNKPQSLGGKARAKRLSPEERSAIARSAAEARWEKMSEITGDPRIQRATHSGILKIGSTEIPVAVLEDGTRVVTQRGMFVALGMNKNPSKGQASIDNRPAFIGASNLNPFIAEDLKRSWNPIPFRLPKGSGGYRGNIAFGYDAKILPLVCQVYLDAREAKELHIVQRHVAEAARILHRGFAIVGIIALVDEATGYQEVRDRQALQEVLRRYISGALFEWTKTFPLEFYKEIFRLKGWAWNNGKMPGAVGGYTNDLIYQRLAPGVFDELQQVNPPTEKGYRQYHNHRFMTRDIGHPALTRHIYRVLGIMEGSTSWETFKHKIDAKLPKLNTTIAMDLGD